MMATGRWTFDGEIGSLDGELVLELYGDTAEPDWNLGREGAFWLSGTMTAPLATGVVSVDMRSLDETIGALTGVRKTFYPLDQRDLSYPLQLQVDGERIRASLDLELDWDYYPAPEKPADYRPHRFTLEVEARVVRRA